MLGWLWSLALGAAGLIGGLLLLLIGWGVVLVTVTAITGRVRRRRSIRRFRTTWGRQGKDLLLVYSNSPNWQAYVETEWLPRWGHRAVVLNWSQRSSWEPPFTPEIALFRAFSGVAEYNPLAIVVPAAGDDVYVVRFWRAFRDYKHGKPAPLKEAEAELDSYLAGKSGLQLAR